MPEPTAEPLHVWVTRAQPGAEETALRLRALGHIPLVAPMLRVEVLDAAVDLEGVGALAFTSPNAVRAFGARLGADTLDDTRSLPVFAVGDATATAARAHGFVSVESAAGDVAALAELIARRAQSRDVVLHLCATEPAGDLVAALQARGLQARPVALYATLEVANLPSDIVEALAAGTLDRVLIHSPKAARAVARLLGPTAESSAPSMALTQALCLSKACAEPLLACGFGRLQVADGPNEDALLARLAHR